ncbi:MAG TPA: PadR family transcriptional regulator [Vicinamibacteria bacterium]
MSLDSYDKKGAPGELVPGTLDMLILKTLSRGPLHGYAIAESIERTSEDVLRVEEGALYPALHRLEVRGLLASEWGVSENNRRAKFYRPTAAGRKHLARETSYWARMIAGIGRVMETA